jgi:membrane associated rhomboid family serine protease
MQKSKSLSALIAALCISVYVCQLFLSGEPISMQALLVAPVELLHKMGANFAPITLLQNQYWRLLTFGFLHAGIIHLALNSYALMEFGPMAEAALGKKVFVFIYILTGVVGGLTSILVNPLQTSVGASASICGVLGAFIFVSWFKRERENSHRLRKPELFCYWFFSATAYCWALLVSLSTMARTWEDFLLAY